MATTTLYKVTVVCDQCGKTVANSQHAEKVIAEGMAKMGENLHAYFAHTEQGGGGFSPEYVATMEATHGRGN